jgi:hypothetical protein
VFTTQIDTGYLIGLIVTGVIMLVFWGVGLYLWLSNSSGGWLESWVGGLVVWLGGWALCVLGFVIFAWPPLPGQYNQYRPVSGRVASTSSRFVASGVENGGTNQRILVTFAGGMQVACDDTRCSDLKPGDPLTLLCERDFQWNALEGWNCNWGAARLNR